MRKPIVLIVRDGWGINPNPEGNAVMAANTPNIDRYKNEYLWSEIKTSGEDVGLPAGFMGSSEVGHLNMGAGRIVIQELKKINDELENGSFFQTENWKKIITNWKKNNSQLHLMGLLQDEGVHAHQSHLFALIKKAREEFNNGKIVVHPFLDGRDTAPQSCLKYLSDLEKVMSEVGGNVKIGTVMGRYYAMDRGKNWKITDRSYDCLVSCIGEKTQNVEEYVKKNYEENKNPDGSEMSDEYIAPAFMEGYEGMNDGDVVIHINYRQDRAIQLTKAFLGDDYPGEVQKRVKVLYFGLTKYYDEFENYLLEIEEGMEMKNLLGQVLADLNLRQLRIAETQKIKHVTSFFNGKSTTPYAGEDDVEIPSRFDPSSFADHPEMEAYNVTDKLLEVLENNPYDFILVNYANCDMVGHTGEFESVKKAVEVVDECVGKVTDKLIEMGGEVLITADHGNAEQTKYYDTHLPMTSHTCFPVELIWVSDNITNKKMKNGRLADVAPTVLGLMGIGKPVEMTGENLISEG